MPNSATNMEANILLAVTAGRLCGTFAVATTRASLAIRATTSLCAFATVTTAACLLGGAAGLGFVTAVAAVRPQVERDDANGNCAQNPASLSGVA